MPDSYPLSLNSLTLGCNQKTARDPVINATEAEVQAAVDALKALSLVFEASGSRVARYEHNMGRALALPSQSVALLAVLMLRGPQTGSELRANCDRLHRFADMSSVEAFLDELAARPEEKGGPLVAEAAARARAPASRAGRSCCAGRWTCRRCRWRQTPRTSSPPANWPRSRPSRPRCRPKLAELRALVERLYAELGVNRS